MKTLRAGEEPRKHYVAVVQIKEVTPAYRVPGGGVVGNTSVVDRQVEDTFSVTVRGASQEQVALFAIGQLETMVDEEIASANAATAEGRS